MAEDYKVSFIETDNENRVYKGKNGRFYIVTYNGTSTYFSEEEQNTVLKIFEKLIPKLTKKIPRMKKLEIRVKY